MSTPKLIIFYDGKCPLCLAEMNRLRQLDSNKYIHTIDLQDKEAVSRYSGLNVERAMNILQGQLADGSFIEGLDVTHKAWSLVGKGRLTKLTRLPILKWIFDGMYLIFAKHRYRISAWLIGQAYASSCDICSASKKDQKHHE